MGSAAAFRRPFVEGVWNQHHVLRLVVNEDSMRVLLTTITTSHEGGLADQGPSVS